MQQELSSKLMVNRFEGINRESTCVECWQSAKFDIARRARAHGIQLPKVWS